MFGEPRTYPVGTSPVGIIAGEFSGTPGLDLATANEGNSVTLLANHGDGVFDSGGRIAINTRFTVTGIVGGRFNTDAIDDFAISADDSESFPDFNGSIVIYRSTAVARYGATGVPIGLFPTCVSLADFTGDGIPDLAGCSSATDLSGLISLLRGNADNTFGANTGIPLGTITPRRLLATDIDHDAAARPDILVVDTPGNAVWILYGLGPGLTFESPVKIATVSSPTAAVVAPFAGGMLPGIAVTSRLNGTVAVFRQESARAFGAPVSYPVGLLPADLGVADFTGEGKLDLVAVNNGSSDVTLLIGKGDGTFERGETVAVADGPVAIVAADFNNDNKMDFATADQDDETFGRDIQSVAVVLNGVSPPFTPTPTFTPTRTPTPSRTPTRTPTGNRTPSRTPTRGTPSPTPTSPAPGDVNCDARFDRADLGAVIARLFNEPSGWCLPRAATAADVPLIVRHLHSAQ